MSLPKISEVRRLSDEELLNEIVESKRKLFKLRFCNATRQLDKPKPHEFKHLKHRISQLLTVQKERELSKLEFNEKTFELNNQSEEFLESQNAEEYSLVEKDVSDENEQTEPKHINIWVTTQEGDLSYKAMINVSYNMNFMIGSSVNGRLDINASLNQNNSDTITPDEIDEDGLNTEWVVSSSAIKLEAIKNNPHVLASSLQVKKDLVWYAKFSLFVPRAIDSETVQLSITPMKNEDMNLEVIIYARNEVFRQFLIHLESKETMQKSKVGTPQLITVEC